MSIRLMSLAWKMPGLNPGQKLVMLALCDNASDEGICFPSVTTIAKKCSMSLRAVQGHIKGFESDRILTRNERPGRSTIYMVNPEALEPTPAESAPPQNLRPTPAESAPLPPQNLPGTPAESAPITINEPSIEPSSKPKSSPMARPDDVPDDVWADFLKLRKVKKAEVTNTALKAMRSQAEQAGITLADAMVECCARGWTGFRAEWMQPRNGNAVAVVKPNGGFMNKQEALEARNREVARQWAEGE